MSAISVRMGEFSINGAYKFLFAFSLFTILVVQAEDKLVIPPTYEDLVADEVYENSRAWRRPADEYGWREQEREKESRIKFGFDPAYEDIRARKSQEFSGNRFELSDPQPSTQFRINF